MWKYFTMYFSLITDHAMTTSNRMNSNPSDAYYLNLGLTSNPPLDMWTHAPRVNGGHVAGTALCYRFGATRE